MSDKTTRKNHYVPVWYQRGFLGPGQSQLFYLNTKPDQIPLPNGEITPKTPLHQWGPKKCFSEHDLYTTTFGALINDDIEKHLFGPIDERGARAVRAFVKGDIHAMHKSFQDFFLYLDAQKLRTPKGLDWIRLHYPALDQVDLMREMQSLRLMHCTMWTEGVLEIVSAENSDVKFIVTDHPVTIYNRALPTTSPECSYPKDPLIDLVGSQTLFALDANTCLILTHLEYAREPNVSNLTSQRTHARYHGQSLVRTDAFIRTRKLARDEIVAINYLLKSRSRQYLAASNEEWLYPERFFSWKWEDIAMVLLPKDKHWHFGGEIFAKFNDGSEYFQDEFGRTSGAHKYLRRRTQQTKLGPNDPCGCGSGHKYKLCCHNLSLEERPSWKVYGMRERNLMFCLAVKDVLGLSTGKTWDDVRRELSDCQVKQIHEHIAYLWPTDTNLQELLPRPSDKILRTIYFGVPDARNISLTVTGWLTYFDEVIIVHPFVNPAGVKQEFNPIHSPNTYKQETLKNVLLLLILEPFIKAGLVHLIPDPGSFNKDFCLATLKMARERAANWTSKTEDMGMLPKLVEDDYRRFYYQMPRKTLEYFIRNNSPTISSELVDKVLENMKREQLADPLALLQTNECSEVGGQFQIIKSFGLETVMYLAALTGAVIYTDIPACWQQLHQHTRASRVTVDSSWKSVLESWQEIIFPISNSLEYILHTSRAGKMGEMRAALRQIIQHSHQALNPTLAGQLASHLTKTARWVHAEEARAEERCLFEGHMEISVPRGGFDQLEVRRLLLTFGSAKQQIKPIPMAIFVRYANSGARN